MGLADLKFSRIAFLVAACLVFNGPAAIAAQTGGAVISEAHYVARVEENLVRVEVTFVIQISTQAEVAIPLHFGNAVVEKPADETVSLQGTGDGKYSLILSGEGERKLQLQLSIPVQGSREDSLLELHCPVSAVTTLDLTVPQADRTIQLQPFSIPLPLEETAAASSDQTRIKVRFGSTSKITARWFSPKPKKPKPDPLVDVTNNLQVVIDEDVIHTSATLSYRVLRGEIEQLQFAVSTRHRVLDVSAAQSVLLDWEISSEDKRQLVTVNFPERLSGSIAIEVHTEATVPEGSLEIAGIGENGAVHGIHAVDVMRESGRLILTDRRSTPSSITKRKSVMRIDESEIPELPQRPHVRYFRFFNPKMQLVLAARETPQNVEPLSFQKATIEKALIEIVCGDSGKSMAEYRCRYRINAGLQKRLGVNLPPGAELISVRINERDVVVEGNQEQDSATQTGNYFVRISDEIKNSDGVLLLTVLFRYPLGPPPFEARLGKLQLPLPKIFFDEKDEVVAQQLRAVVRIPERFSLIGRPEDFSLESAIGLSAVWRSRWGNGRRSEQLDGWIGDRSGTSNGFQPGGFAYRYRRLGATDVLEVTWCDMPFAGWALSLPLFLIAWVLGRTSWRNKLSVLLLGCFATALFALEEPDWVYHGLIAARYGMLAMLGWWLIQSLPGVHSRRLRTFPASMTPPSPTTSPTAVVVPPPGVFEALKSDWNRGKPAATV